LKISGQTLIEIAALMQGIALLLAGIWAIYKVSEYRELRTIMQLELDANLYKLASPVTASVPSWNKRGEREKIGPEPRSYVVEVLLKFSNKGRTRFRLFNAQIGINTMRDPAKAKTEFDQTDGHLHLTRIFTSGNVVPIFKIPGRPIEETSFYYVEPGIQQTITYLALIPEPRELLQIFASFSLEQERLFPERQTGKSGLYPHTSARTYQVSPEGRLIGQEKADLQHQPLLGP
jgi:hypothetical protein